MVTKWYAISNGALDLRDRREEFPGVDIAVIPVIPAEPMGLRGEVGDLWCSLTGTGRDERTMTTEELALIQDFQQFGIASTDDQSHHRLKLLQAPWLSSPLHELVYSLVVNIAQDLKIKVIPIKGPLLRRQGLRDRDHSGDVDVLVDPARLNELIVRLSEWGWSKAPDVWDGTEVNHSVTLSPGSWGCEIDLHRHMPGCAITDAEFFSVINAHTAHVNFASTPCFAPTIPTHAVLYALHAMRPDRGRGQEHARQSEDAIIAASSALSTAGTPALEIAEELRASAALSQALKSAFPTSFSVPDYAPPLNWTWRAHSSRVVGYWKALALAKPIQRPRLFIRLIWPSSNVVELTNRNAGLTKPNGSGSRIRRWIRAIKF